MRTIEVHNCADYLADVGLIATTEPITVRRLAGGVSNVVFHVIRDPARGGNFVLKQARGQLQVEQPWFCSVERIWREVAVLRVCESILGNSTAGLRLVPDAGDGLQTRPIWAVPEVLFEDRENYVFAMTAAPDGHRCWKEMLMSGQLDPDIASACGELLGTLHAGTWEDEALAKQFGDRQFFRDLRVDPYYRRVAEVHPDLKPAIEELIASLESNATCLVHGDFSPKNLLVTARQGESPPTIALIDFEVGHFGDAAFDLGFFLSHLVLKGVYHQRLSNGPATAPLSEAFWQSYSASIHSKISSNAFDLLQQRAVANLAGCLLARVDGKSPVDYLRDESQRRSVRRMGRELVGGSVDSLPEAIQVCGNETSESLE